MKIVMQKEKQLTIFMISLTVLMLSLIKDISFSVTTLMMDNVFTKIQQLNAPKVSTQVLIIISMQSVTTEKKKKFLKFHRMILI